MSNRSFSAEEKRKLSHLISEGISVMTEVETLNGGLADTVKAIGSEMDIKPSILKKAIRTAYKASYQKTQEEHGLLEDILETVGRTL
jgi:transposase-like protein